MLEAAFGFVPGTLFRTGPIATLRRLRPLIVVVPGPIRTEGNTFSGGQESYSPSIVPRILAFEGGVA
jgi:hypothetical protein